MEEYKYKCNKCNGIFDDKQRDSEDDNRCPLCKIAFSQMPYEAPHEISDYSLVHKHDGGDSAGLVDCLKCEKQSYRCGRLKTKKVLIGEKV